ncbi:MAG: hypothetical protein A3A73_01345 [Omnitrophica bacterium RIFCSPLOWO2_01_FULL_50_24]|nr:MAG: hypothetical protein A3A73_01345 [Omnitrophica bacterium RIFCSPLOWO2_01_FULL_50_24]
MNPWIHRIATCGPIGKVSWGGGTFGSLIAVPFIFFAPTTSWYYLVVTGTLLVVAVWTSGVTAADLKDSDPNSVVIDEVVGMLISFCFVPVTWKTLAVGFVLFRTFDIVKPPPIRWVERLPKGFGIVLDDVAAGIYANLILQVWVHYAHM